MTGQSLRSRMELAGPLWKAMATRFDAIVVAMNEISATLFGGQNPHKANDTADVVTVDPANSIDTVVDLEQPLIDNYETHIGSTSYHTGADSTNVVTEVGLAKECYVLLNAEKTKYNLNRVNVTSHHGGSGDTTNVVDAADADTKAKAITLANQIKTKLIAHMALTAGSVHGSADAASGVALAAIADLTSGATWDQIRIMADAIRVAYEAHRVYTTGACHAGADSTNTLSATPAIGTTTTAIYAGLNELKVDMIAHFAEFGTSHQIKDASITISSADATTTNTAIALVNEMKTKFNDHISRADQVAASAIPSLDLDE